MSPAHKVTQHFRLPLAFMERWRARLRAEVVCMDESLWHPRAEEVGRLGWQAFAAGNRTSPFELAPRYFRRAAAEEKADVERQKAEGRRTKDEAT